MGSCSLGLEIEYVYQLLFFLFSLINIITSSRKYVNRSLQQLPDFNDGMREQLKEIGTVEIPD